MTYYDWAIDAGMDYEPVEPYESWECEGCGEVCTGRSADKVCRDCQHSIDEWRKHLRETKADRTFSTVCLKGAYHWYPLFYFGGPRITIDGFNETRDQLGILFARLGELSCKEKLSWEDMRGENPPSLFERPDSDYPASEGSPCYRPVYGKIDQELLTVIRSLWDHTARFAEMAYLGGVYDGRDILFQLSSGQISTTQMQDRDMKLACKLQSTAARYRRLAARKKEIPS